MQLPVPKPVAGVFGSTLYRGTVTHAHPGGECNVRRALLQPVTGSFCAGMAMSGHACALYYLAAPREFDVTLCINFFDGVFIETCAIFGSKIHPTYVGFGTFCGSLGVNVSFLSPWFPSKSGLIHKLVVKTYQTRFTFD
jgi:hypothetical protein